MGEGDIGFFRVLNTVSIGISGEAIAVSILVYLLNSFESFHSVNQISLYLPWDI